MIANITRRSIGRRLLVGLSLTLLVAPAQSQPLTQRSLKAGRWTIEWSEKAGRARHPGGGTIVLWRQPTKTPGCEQNESGNLLSVVGTVVSYDKSSDGYCQGWAHPSHEAGFATIDLSRAEGSRDVTLYDIFDEPQLTQELQRIWKADPVLRESSEGAFVITSFAFHHVVGDKVNVRVALTPGGSVGGGYTIEVELLLKPRPEMLLALRRADKAGTLMNRLAPAYE